MTQIIECPRCRTRVIAVGNRCPACGQDATPGAGSPANGALGAPKPAKRAPAHHRHPVLNVIGAVLIAAGLVRWWLVGIASMMDVIWDLGLIWAGVLFILLVMLANHLRQR